MTYSMRRGKKCGPRKPMVSGCCPATVCARLELPMLRALKSSTPCKLNDSTLTRSCCTRGHKRTVRIALTDISSPCARSSGTAAPSHAASAYCVDCEPSPSGSRDVVRTVRRCVCRVPMCCAACRVVCALEPLPCAAASDGGLQRQSRSPPAPIGSSGQGNIERGIRRSPFKHLQAKKVGFVSHTVSLSRHVQH
jgi:hypothetical protein